MSVREPFRRHAVSGPMGPGSASRLLASLAAGVVTLASCGDPVYSQTPREPVWQLHAPAPPSVPEPESAVSFVNRLGMRMVRVPAGTRVLGTPAGEAGRSADETVRTVTMPAFWVSQTEVTQAQFQALMGFNPSRFRDPDRPVENVLITEAIAFGAMLSEIDGRPYRLPDEDAWEFACRAGEGGEAPPAAGADAAPRRVADTHRDSGGIHGMIGNVAELCANAYLPDPRMPESERVRHLRRSVEVCVRGGSWDSPRFELRPGFRGRCDPHVAEDTIGFRVISFPENAR